MVPTVVTLQPDLRLVERSPRSFYLNVACIYDKPQIAVHCLICFVKLSSKVIILELYLYMIAIGFILVL